MIPFNILADFMQTTLFMQFFFYLVTLQS